MKFLRELPEAVAKNWDFYAPVIAKSLPPISGNSHRYMVNILEAILRGKLLVWNFKNDKDELIFIMTTTIDYDEVSKTRSLLIYSMSGFMKVENRMFLYAISKLKRFAKSQACEFITAYVESEKITNYLTNGQVGARANYKLIELEV